MDIYGQINRHLSSDERLIYPEMYDKRPYMYDKVLGAVYLVKSKDRTPGSYDWVWEHSLRRIMDGDFKILHKMLLVRVRDPNMVAPGWIISDEEYQEDPDKYVVLDKCIVVVDNGWPATTRNVTVEEYHENNDVYDMIGVCYLVVTSPPEVY